MKARWALTGLLLYSLLGLLSAPLKAIQPQPPDSPRVMELLPPQTLGKSGGSIHMLMAKSKDIRMMNVYGYARLVGYDRNFELIPDILLAYENEDDRIFTFHLRPGHRWSDGVPFTSEDFRFYWEDVALNEELSPFGPPQSMMVDGEPPVLEVIDELTLRYSWSSPNPNFLPQLAGPRALDLYLPAHYMRQFHARYAEPERLQDRQEKASKRNWVALLKSRAHLYQMDNPELPTLQPWYNSTPAPADRFVFLRNPFFHRVDARGTQLPYIDEVVINIVGSSLIAAKARAGESDLQGRYIRLDNYTFLKQGEQSGGYQVRFWKAARGSQFAIYPNLNAKDDQWRTLNRDVRFRRALSLAINRHEINQVVYYGLAEEGGNTLLPESTLFQEDFMKAWNQYDPRQANDLLDELGLLERDARGIRLLPDGRPMEVVVHTAGEETEETDVLQLVHDHWMEVGIKLHIRPSQREVFRNRVFSGEAIMSVWKGLDNALATSDMSPWELAPYSQQQLQWPMWGNYYETGKGDPPDLLPAKRLRTLVETWESSRNRQQRWDIWQEMLRIYSNQVFSIGTVTGIMQPIVVSNRLRNVPVQGWYSWEPGSYFGIYNPDTFWLRDAEGAR
ncbi:ABC transporter substrate-binding protein [Aestuariirhabdus litorea]|uniref:ABC transporter substrate-binding protein n=1 Tax=Aestuariirhabdus litorea TaxID=2528527 RepID=A0A3P3VVH8_9GAMM|nr:ABC transporter substrate-binding protein [Aestuariirhabdus litorea]RRJ84753.1 ABC transporter substrate-binding protein [Aestuariirhabdus litorea]RWW97978.1 ABC transporter substrate-binding protein [Endozoicomonadaceae bacterium GTF-13]